MEHRRASGQLPGLALQALAVLGSILVAFAIDASWDARSDRAAERELLESLRSELLQNQEILGGRIEFATALEASALALLQLATGSGSEESADSVEHLLADVSWYDTPSWERATVDALVSSGDLALIRDRAVRARVSGWTRAVERVSSFEDGAASNARDDWTAYLTRNGDLISLGRAQVRTPGSGRPYEEALRLPEVRPVDHRPLLADVEFRNHLVLRYWALADLLGAYGSFGGTLANTLAVIDEALEIARR